MIQNHEIDYKIYGEEMQYVEVELDPNESAIAERLRRPMRKMFGGTWISFLGIPPFTFIFLFLMVAAMIKQKIKVKARKNKLRNAGETFVGSWF